MGIYALNPEMLLPAAWGACISLGRVLTSIRISKNLSKSMYELILQGVNPSARGRHDKTSIAGTGHEQGQFHKQC